MNKRLGSVCPPKRDGTGAGVLIVLAGSTQYLGPTSSRFSDINKLPNPTGVGGHHRVASIAGESGLELKRVLQHAVHPELAG
jgi:hypothetical protein